MFSTTRKIVFFTIVLGLICLFQTGCRRNDGDNQVAATILGTNSTSNEANVSFRLVFPQKKTGAKLANILPAIDAPAVVTFQIKLLNYGNTSNPLFTISKQVPVVNGSASAIFESLPATTVLAQIHIENGKIQGYSEFHGAADLNQGANIMELAPVGSLIPQDIVAKTLEKIFDFPDSISNLPSNLAFETSKIVNSMSSNLSGTSYEEAFTILSSGHLTPPVVLAIEPDINLIQISWSPIYKAEFYNIYFSNSPNVTKTANNRLISNTNFFQHTGLTNGLSYYYLITAQNSVMESENSVVIKAIPGEFAGGDGSVNNPYQIATPKHLNRVRDYLASHFILISDIDLSEQDLSKESWYSLDYGWFPIGDSSSPFLGTFDGQNHKIMNLTISARNFDENGLFGTAGGWEATQKSTIKGVIIEQCNIVGGGNTGSLAGINNGLIDNCSSSGLVSGLGNTGGFVGNNIGSITNSLCSVTTKGLKTGGFVGINQNFIKNCRASGLVSGETSVGGIAGSNFDSMSNRHITLIEHCSFSGSVEGLNEIGGVVGCNYQSIISNCYNSGSVKGSFKVGGLAGINDERGQIIYSYNNGPVSGAANANAIGGLLGRNESSIIEVCFNAGKVTGDYCVGGCIGIGYFSSMSNCYNIGAVIGSEYVGGCVGLNSDSTVVNSFNAGSIAGSKKTGGLVGENNDLSSVSKSFWDKEVTLLDYSAGGFAKTTAEMKRSSTFLWDFNEIWQISEGITYPYFINAYQNRSLH